MPHRIKWLSLEGIKKMPIDTLIARMSSAQYSSTKSAGFSLGTSGKSYINGEYIERFEYTETIENPLGGPPFNYKQTRFKRTQFSITNSDYPIELENPAANISELLNLLAEYLGYNVSITTPSVDVERWTTAVLSKLTGAIVDRMRISHIQMSDLANATAVVTGIEDVRQHAAKLSRKKHRIDLMRIASEEGRFEFSRTGGVSSDLPIPDSVRKIAKSSLIESSS